MISSHRLIKTALCNGHRGKRQGGTGEQFAVISNQQELEQHRAVVPKASQSEGFVSPSLTKKQKKKRDLEIPLELSLMLGFKAPECRQETERVKQQHRMVGNVHFNFSDRRAREFRGLAEQLCHLIRQA